MKTVLLECVVSGRERSLAPRKLAGEIGVAGGPRVFVLPDREAATAKRRIRGLVDRQPKNSKTQLARIFGKLEPGQCGICRREYTRSGQLMRSMETLLRHLQERSHRVTCFLQVPDAMFDALCGLATDPDTEDTAGVGRSYHRRMVARISEALHDDSVPPELENEYVGNAPGIQRVRQMIWRVSETQHPVLITGESGTGKEIVARCIHRCTKERQKRGPVFNPINCGAVQESLFESELFGHAKGAFTGAGAARAGLWKAAGNGTLFLDEVADLDPGNQAKMLRALQFGEVRPVGSDINVKVEARIISATNRDLYGMALYGRFRRDLYHRLSTHRIVVPPLRDHPEDIGLIAQHLWRKTCGDEVRPLPDVVIETLTERDWPGNVRELHNVIFAMRNLVRGEIHSRAQVEMAMYYIDNPAAVFLSGRAENLSPDARLSATMRQLKGTRRALDEVANSLSQPRDLRTIEPEERSMILTGLDDRRHELADLVSIPLLFGTADCFNIVNEAAGKVAYFLDALHTDPNALPEKEQRSVAKTVERAREAVTEQIEATLAQARS